MKKIRERTYLKRIVSFFIGLLIGWIFYLFIVAGITGGPISSRGECFAVLFSLLTIIIYEIIAEYNYLKRLEFTTASLYSNISIYKQREIKLISKAEELALKYSQHESDIQKSVASLRSGNIEGSLTDKEARTLNDLKITIESYPDLKSDKHISKILNQLEESQNTILNSKLLYNEYVTYYNSAIISVPAVLFSGIWRLKPLQFYVETEVDEI